MVRGIDERPVVSFRERKSIGAERTYETDHYNIEVVKEKLVEVIDIMWNRCELKNKTGKTITRKLRFANFSTITRSYTNKNYFTKGGIISILISLLPNDEISEQGVRLLGATMSHFQDENKP